MPAVVLPWSVVAHRLNGTITCWRRVLRNHAGDKPELRWPEARAELSAMGLRSTLEYVGVAAEAVLRHTGLLPHVNAGIMGPDDVARWGRGGVWRGRVGPQQGCVHRAAAHDLH